MPAATAPSPDELDHLAETVTAMPQAERQEFLFWVSLATFAEEYAPHERALHVFIRSHFSEIGMETRTAPPAVFATLVAWELGVERLGVPFFWAGFCSVARHYAPGDRLLREQLRLQQHASYPEGAEK